MSYLLGDLVWAALIIFIASLLPGPWTFHGRRSFKVPQAWKEKYGYRRKE